MKARKIEISGEEAEALLGRVKNSVTEEDYQIIKGLVDTHLLLGQAVAELAWCTSGMGMILWGVSPLYVTPVTVKMIGT